MTPQAYLHITRTAGAITESRLVLEIARLRVAQAEDQFNAALRAAGLDPAVEHRFDDATMAIEPVAAPVE